jgi:branched-subunit amino acid ABC-type transport system permease component
VMRRSMFEALASYAVMGAALGAALSLLLICVPAFHVAGLIDLSMERWTTMLVVVGALMTTFGVDATLTGFLLLMIDDSKGKNLQAHHRSLQSDANGT